VSPVLLAVRDPDRLTGLLWILFVIVPFVARIWKASREKKEQERKARADSNSAAPRPAPSPAEARTAQRESEEVGEDIWERMLRGEEPAAPPPRPAPVFADEACPEPGAEALEPAPLSMLGEVREPSEAAEVSLESEAEPKPLGALESAPEEALAPEAGARARLLLGRGELRRALLYSEILGPPVSMR